MSDILGSLGDAAGAAFDFVTPNTQRRNAGFSFADLVNDAYDYGRNTLLGGVSAIDDLVSGEGSAASKLFGVGLIGAGLTGAALGARHLAGEAKAARRVELPALARWSPEAGSLGLKPRFSPTTFEGEALVRQYPGIRPRTADIMGGQDYIESATHLLLDKDPVKAGMSAAVMRSYADQLTDLPPEHRLGATQLDFAKIDTAVDGGLLFVSKDVAKGAGHLNARFNELWTKFKAGDLTDEAEVGEFLGTAKSIGDATRDLVNPDFSFDMVASVDRIDLTPAGPIVRVKVPQWSDQLAFTDAAVRSERIRSLNLRPMAARGKAFMLKLYDLGIAEERNPGALPRPLKRGSHWYAEANKEITDELPNLGDVPWADHSKLTAAVSLTSEAQDWEQNIPMASRVLRMANRPEVMDPDFQDWLRNGKFTDAVAGTGKRVYSGTRAAEHQHTFRKLHNEIRQGNKLTDRDFNKVLRLASESPEELFLSTTGKKQKNFYLNLKDSSDPVPVTIDRHMHDVFLGVSSSSDFKLMEKNSLSESNYDIIADTLREAADERGVLPNVLQGVVWEAWKALKEDHKVGQFDDWKARNPFRLPEPDGSENLVFQALQGRYGTNLSSALASVGDRIPLVLGGDSYGVYTTPDGGFGVLSKPTRQAANQFPHLYPAVMRDDGVAMWGKMAPRQVLDVEAHRALADQTMVGHTSETWVGDAWAGNGGHPAVLGQDTIMYDLPGDKLPKGVGRYGKMFDPGMPTVASRPTRLRAKLGIKDLDLDAFEDPKRSPLMTHDYATLAASITDEQAAHFGISSYDNAVRHNQLGAKLRRMGYKPIEQVGVYEGIEEKSYLVFGMSPEDAIKLGKEFNQDSVMTNDHMWYTNGEHAGLAQKFEESNMNLRVPESAYFRSVTKIGNEEVKWASGYTGDEAFDEVNPATIWAERKNERVRRVAIQVPPAQAHRIHEIADELELSGGRVHSIYSSGEAPAGWKAVREHLHQDGSTMTVTRTLDPEIDSMHGRTAWVRNGDADGLPAENPQGRRLNGMRQVEERPGLVVLNGAAVVNTQGYRWNGSLMSMVGEDGHRPQSFVLYRQNGVPSFNPTPYHPSELEGMISPDSVLINVENGFNLRMIVDPEDLSKVAFATEALGAAGVDPSYLRADAGMAVVEANVPSPKGELGYARTVFGDEVRKLKRNGPALQQFVDRFGIEVDRSFREGDEIFHLPEETYGGFGDMLDTLYANPTHKDMLQLVQFNRIGVQSTYGDPYLRDAVAWYEGGGGGAITLNADWWVSPLAVADSRIHAVRTKFTSPLLPTTPESYVMHELGHAMHEAVLQSFRSQGDADKFNKVLDKIRKSYKLPQMREQMSEYAAANLHELAAECIAEAVFAKQPRELALRVYGMMMDAYAENTTYREAIGWRATA